MSLPMPKKRADRDTVLRYAREMDYAKFPPIRVVKMQDAYILTTIQRKETS